MDRLSEFIEVNLNGYNLPMDTLTEIRAVLIKRFGAKFSEGLSPEGRLAMEQAAKREVESAKSTRSKRQSASSSKQNKNKEDHSGKRSNVINFQETYARSSTRRLGGDITDETYREMDLRKRAIGGKLENAFETIEIVTHGEENIQTMNKIDNDRRHSVEKCLVWMEVNNKVPTPSVPGSAYSMNTQTPESEL